MRWDREKLPTPDSHVYGENGEEIMVYNMKRHSRKRGGQKEKQSKRKVEEIQQYKGKTLNY